MELMEGVVDIYMPDFKLWSEERSAAWLKAADYPDTARSVIRAMHDQVGPLEIGPDGVARRGVLVRHLVMPGAIDETIAILEWLARELGPGTYVNLMDQYRPAGKVGGGRYSELARRPTGSDYASALTVARELGLRLDRRGPGV